jgi:hypothetical protein
MQPIPKDNFDSSTLRQNGCVHVNERHPVGSNAVRISAFGVY